MTARLMEEPLIDLSPDLKLPVDAVTQTFAFIARKGGGKTYGAGKLAEEMVAAHGQIVVIDPVGNWYGLRLAKDGKGAGLPIYVFGGEHGDLPLHPDMGARIADLIAEKRISAVLDVSAFRKGEREKFAAAFAEQFFHRKKTQRSPVHLFVEEAQKFIPQNPFPGEKQMLGAFEDIVRLGRNYGIGATLISQRPQSVNKEVLSQVECLIVLQVNGAHERKAIEAWVSEHGLDRGLVGELPGLHQGEAFVWSPQWLRIFKRIKIGLKKTFDASATPKVGEKVIRPGELSPLDIKSLESSMAESIERARADDPRELRKRIAELERAAQVKPAAIDPNAVAAAEKRGYECGVLAGLEKAGQMAGEVHNAIDAAIQTIRTLSHGLAVDIQRGPALSNGTHSVSHAATRQLPSQSIETKAPQSGLEPRRTETVRPNRETASLVYVRGLGDKLSKAERKILTALAQYPAGRTKVQVAILTGYAHNGGGFNNAISALRSRAFLEGSGESITITRAGRSALGSYDPLPSGRALADHWMGQLSKAEKSALQVLIEAYPRALDKATLAERAGYEANGGGFNNALSRLRTLELVTGRGELRASEDLF